MSLGTAAQGAAPTPQQAEWPLRGDRASGGGGSGLPLQLEASCLLPCAPEIEGLGFQPQQVNATFPFLSQPGGMGGVEELSVGFLSLSHTRARRKATKVICLFYSIAKPRMGGMGPPPSFLLRDLSLGRPIAMSPDCLLCSMYLFVKGVCVCVCVYLCPP